MTSQRFVGITLLGVAIVYFFGKAKAGSDLIVDLVKAKLNTLQIGSSPKLILTFELSNPTNFALTINGVAGNVYLSDKFISNFYSYSKIVIPAMGKVNYEVNALVSVMQSVVAVRDMIKQGKKFNVNIRGVVNAEGFQLPIEKNISLSI